MWLRLLFLFQEIFHPLGESEFLSGRFLQLLLDIGFCGEKYTEKVCYDVAEIIFGFDDPNSNMVSKNSGALAANY